MNKILIIIVTTLFIVSCNKSALEDKPYNQGINITPVPMEQTIGEGVFKLNKQVTFVSFDENTDAVIAYFTDKISKSTGYQLKTERTFRADNYINLNIVEDINVNEEGYLLSVIPQGIDIKAKTPQGLFYAMQTLMQLLPAEIESPQLVKNIAWEIPAVTIKDEPRFGYRGQHLDVCRHFSDVEFIKKQLDVLAMFKINKFHWHLTEDQGWRIEIKKYPKLAELSSMRVEGDGTVYGPHFYTHEQVKEVIAYAKERFIEVIPEIEFPGHAVAALTAYPHLSCTGGPFDVRNVWGISNDIFCAGNEETFQFMEDVLTEVASLFESEYIHIGGDEAPKGRWETCPKCQARIKAENLKGDKHHTKEEQLQSYFIHRIEEVVTKLGKKMIGWEEILEGGLASSATVMSWLGEESAVLAGNSGNDVIMTPYQWVYLDYFQQEDRVSPTTIGGFLPLSVTYNYEPMPEALDESKRHHILGVQSNLWTEYQYQPELIEYRLYPRVLAVAELGWSQPKLKNYDDFLGRLENQRARLDMHNINYFIPVPEHDGMPSCDFIAFIDSASLALKAGEPVKIVYTTDGSEPNAQSPVYESPLTFTENTTVKTRSIVLSGKMGLVRTIVFEKQTHTPAVKHSEEVNPGLKVEYYKGVMSQVAQLYGRSPNETDWIERPQNAKYRVPDYRELFPEDYYNTVLTGYLDIPEDGVYYFSTLATQFWIGNKLLITNEGTVSKHPHYDSSIALEKGLHPIKIVRLSGIVGGWPPLWDEISISIRKETDASFESLKSSFFY